MEKIQAPFGHAEHDVHPDVPGEWAHHPDVAVQPLFEVAIVDVLVYKYPEITSNHQTNYHKKQCSYDAAVTNAQRVLFLYRWAPSAQ